MKYLKLFILLAILGLIAFFFGGKLARKHDIGCPVCIQGKKNAEHRGLCTFYKKKEAFVKEIFERKKEELEEEKKN